MNDIFHHISCPNPYRPPEGMEEGDLTELLVKEFEDTIERLGSNNIGGFLAEPIQASGGVIIPPDSYLRRIREVCKTHNILFVADEVVTAFGRLGHWFASEDEFGMIPDIICSAKGLSSGYLPIGAMIYSREVHEVISQSESGYFTSGFTYAGHPVSCAAALKNIEIMEREDILKNAHDVGLYFENKLSTLNDLPLVGNVRGKKMMMCVENVANKETKELLPDELNVGKLISNKAEELGLLVRPLGHLNVMSPALNITTEDIDFIVLNLKKSIVSVTDSLVRSGHKIS